MEHKIAYERVGRDRKGRPTAGEMGETYADYDVPVQVGDWVTFDIDGTKGSGKVWNRAIGPSPEPPLIFVRIDE